MLKILRAAYLCEKNVFTVLHDSRRGCENTLQSCLQEYFGI